MAHDEYDAEQFGPAITRKPLIPRWRVKEITSSSEEDSENEQLDTDEQFEKRHLKYEIEEKRLIKKDALIKETRSKVCYQFVGFCFSEKLSISRKLSIIRNLSIIRHLSIIRCFLFSRIATFQTQKTPKCETFV